MLKRRGFLQPAYEIYGGLAGFYDYGPLGAALKKNLEDQWRTFYVLGEGMAEIFTPTISPEPVFRASGHLASFQDPLIECGNCKANLRADKLLEEARDGKVGDAAVRKFEELFGTTLAEANIGTFKLHQLDEALRILEPKCPECGQLQWGEAHFFNLMFKAPVGPGARAKDAYLRPETAQGMFTVFPWLYRYFREQLPFGAVQLGKAYRNEIAPRQALLRLREFHQMEAEVFFHPDRKTHQGFAGVALDELPLVPAQGRTREEVKAGSIVRMGVGEAVRKGIIASEALGYFLWLTHRYLTTVGLPTERLRFRQHAREEMAHYSSDTWDCEYLSPRFGWVEIVGIADRTDYDLKAHGKVSGHRLAHLERYPEPREVEVTRVVPDRAKLGKALKADAGPVMEALKAMPAEWVAQRDGQRRPVEGTVAEAAVEADGSLVVHVNGKELRVAADQYKVEKVKEKVAGDYVVPHVIEPSYGVDRILYSVLEANFKPGKGEDELTKLTLPAGVAPLHVGVFPLMGKDHLDTTARHLAEDLRKSGVHAWYDDSGSIGKRYARMDEVGTPFCVTVDFESVEPGAQKHTVTVRERDTGQQKRVKVAELIGWIRARLEAPLQKVLA